MAPTRSNNVPPVRLTLLAALLSLSGCATLSQPDPVDPAAPSSKSSAASQGTEAAPSPNANKQAGAAGAHDIPGFENGDQLIAVQDYPDIWQRIRAGYSMPVLDSHLVGVHERWFERNPEYIENMVSRARFYLYYIVEEVEKRGMPMEIALLPAIESAYKPHAYSRARAVGLWQFIKSTGRVYGLETTWWYDGRRDVIASTQAALDYLEKLYTQFNDWQLALAAYNCGEGKVERLVKENRRKGLPTDYSSLKKLPRETKNYVPKLMAMANIVADPEKHGLKLAAIPNTEYFARIEMEGQIDLGVVARLTNIPVDDLFMINPGHQRWITDPKGPHTLLVPADKKDVLLEGLSKLSDEERVQWARHEVKRGDTMSRIAGRYGVTVESIRQSNSLSSNHLSIGQNLLIPVSANKVALAAIQPPAYIKAVHQPANGARVKIVHRVRSGETLWSIARRYRVYVNQLREWNLLEDNDVLKMGQRLSIWTTRGASSSAAKMLGNPG